MKAVGFLSFALLLGACALKPKLTGKVWSLVDISTPSMTTPSLGSLGSFLRFYDDGTYTGKIMTGFHYGKWTLSNDVLTLNLNDTSALHYKVVSRKGDNLVIRLTGTADQPLEADLQYEAGPVIDDRARDAFSLQNNLWEIPARHPETDARILARVQNHIRCQLLYIQKAIDLKEASLSTTEFVSPLEFYGNGIGLKPEAKVPGDWTRLFYDSADAERGYEALKNGFRAQMDLPNTQNTFLLYKAILGQLYAKVYLDTNSILIMPASRR